ncbi:MAG: DUF4197 domain-containing protein [Bacteroidota bacterium]
MKKIFFFLSATLLLAAGCDTLKQMNLPVNVPTALTTTEIVNGLKEALNTGTNNSISFLGKADGFLNNPLFKVPFPEEAKRAETKLRELGMNKLVDDFITTMNHGAENAVAKAGPIFLNAITSMTFEDAKKILKGADNAATEYFKLKTTTALTGLFKPEIKKALDAVNATKYWTDITTTYNKIPFVTKIDTDLPNFVTGKAMNALFTKIADEEKNIRTNPAARVKDILKKVFDPNAIVN